jgi:hypothetical protein
MITRSVADSDVFHGGSMAAKKPAKKVKVKDLKAVKGGKVTGGARKSGEGQKDFLP